MPNIQNKPTVNKTVVKPPVIFPFKRTLFQGMQGKEVEVLQNWLNELNEYYNFNPGASINPTGKYGLYTKTWVKKFQKFVNLPDNGGVFDYKTYDILQWRFANMIEGYAKRAGVSY